MKERKDTYDAHRSPVEVAFSAEDDGFASWDTLLHVSPLAC